MNENIIEMYAADNLPFISGVHQWGIDVIRIIQGIENPTLTALVKFITALGTEALYFPLILLIFWWIDEKQGLRFGVIVIVSAWINSVLKDIFKQPRPYNLDPSIGMASESSYGIPSGHAQNSASFWIPMAAWLSGIWTKKRRLIWIGVIVFLLLMGFTRLYLGVHFPTDLFAGWLISGVILALWFIPGPRLEKRLASSGLRFQSIFAALIALVMSSLYPADRMLAAVFLGFCLGYILMKKHFPFSARGEIKGKKPGVVKMVFRCITGFLGVVIIYAGLKLLFPGEGSLFDSIPLWGHASPFYEIGRFIRYGLIGFWVAAGAPWVFLKMRLAAPSSENVTTNVNEKAGGGNKSP